MKSVNTFDLIIVFTYFLVIMGIGLFFVKINKGGKEYFTGGSMIPWWMSGISLYMGNFSAWIFTGAAGFAYTTGWFTILYFSAGPIAYLIGTAMTATKWRRTRSISPMQYTQSRYNLTTQQFLSWVISTNFILSGGVQLASTCKLFAPIIGIDLTAIVLMIGSVVLLHNFLGGVWGDMAMDVVQGVILLGITFVVMPLSLHMIGGLGNLINALPPLSFDHTYNGVHYTEHWLLSILLISSIGFASGGAQRFYSVKDEKNAKRVGRTAAVLALSVPLVFGIPPLVAKVYWPDLSQVPFFQPYIGKNPQDLVFVGLVMKLLPHGLIGVFIAAMLAATMTTLSTVYNMVSSIISHDIYKGMYRPDLDDKGLLKAGRIAAFSIGLVVMVLAILFVNSKCGIFNLMQAFFTLFNIPVAVPIAFGLIFRRIPKWSAAGAITWGLIVGATTRYLLGWDIGPQVYLSFVVTFGVLVTAPLTGKLYQRSKPGPCHRKCDRAGRKPVRIRAPLLVGNRRRPENRGGVLQEGRHADRRGHGGLWSREAAGVYAPAGRPHDYLHRLACVGRVLHTPRDKRDHRCCRDDHAAARVRCMYVGLREERGATGSGRACALEFKGITIISHTRWWAAAPLATECVFCAPGRQTKTAARFQSTKRFRR